MTNLERIADGGRSIINKCYQRLAIDRLQFSPNKGLCPVQYRQWSSMKIFSSSENSLTEILDLKSR